MSVQDITESRSIYLCLLSAFRQYQSKLEEGMCWVDHPMLITMSSLQLLGLAVSLVYCCSHTGETLFSHQDSVIHVISHQWKKMTTFSDGLLLQAIVSILMPWFHLYFNDLSYEGLFTHLNGKSCGPKEANRQNLWLHKSLVSKQSVCNLEQDKYCHGHP